MRLQEGVLLEGCVITDVADAIARLTLDPSSTMHMIRLDAAHPGMGGSKFGVTFPIRDEPLLKGDQNGAFFIDSGDGTI